MAEVEEELMNMNEEELHMDGEVHEDGEELNEDKEKDLDGIKLEVVEGNKEGSRLGCPLFCKMSLIDFIMGVMLR